MAAGVQLNYGSQSDRGLLPGQWADSGYHDAISLTNKDPQASQVDDVTVGGGWVAGNIYTWTIDGIAFSYTTVAADVNNDGVATAIAAQMMAEPLFGGRIYPTALGAVVTLTARVPGLGWTYVAGTNLVVVHTTANDEADPVPFGVGVLDAGQSSSGLERYGVLAQATSLTARSVVLTPTGEPLASYHVDVTVQGDDGISREYVATFTDDDRAFLDVGSAPLAADEIRFTSLRDGADGEDISVGIVAGGGNNDALSVIVDGDAIVIQPSTDDAGAIACTAAEVIEAIEEGTPRIVTNTIAANNAVQWENISGVPLSIVITAAAGAGVAVASGADGIVTITFDAAAGPATTAADMITAVNGDAAASLYVHLQGAGASTGAGNVAVLGATPLDPVPSMAMANGMVSSAATGTGTGNVVAAAPAALALEAPTAATVCAALAANLNAQLPAATVLATAAGTLTLASELAGKDFEYSLGDGSAAALWTVTSDNQAPATDVERKLAGVSVHTYSVEMNDDGDAEYPGGSCMSVANKGRVVVNTEDEVTMGTSVPYIRLADSLATGNQIGGFRASAATDCVKLTGWRFARKISATQAVIERI